MKLRVAALVIMFSCVIGLAVDAQPLADKLPSDTVFYVGWQGVSTLPGYAGSHLQGFLDGSSIPQFFNDFIPRVAQFAASKDREMAKAMPMIAAVVKPLWNYPSAIYFGGLDTTGGRPTPKLAVLINAGADAENVRQGIANVVAMTGNDPPMTTETKDGIVVVAVGKTLPASLQASLAGQGSILQGEASFKGAMDQLVKQPGFSLYVNLQEVWAMLDRMAPPAHGSDPSWTSVRDTLGLPGAKALAVASGFDGKDWCDSAVLVAPSPRSGLLKAMESAPVADDFLKIIPKTSLSMAAGRFRPGSLLDAARGIWPMFGNDVPPLDGMLQQVSGMLGFDIDKDFLAAFGDEWAVYTDASIGGTGIVGTVLVNRTANGPRLEQSLSAIEKMANAIIAANIHDKDVKLEFKTQQVGDLKLHYFALPLISPSWAIKDGTMYVGLLPQTVVGAARLAAHKGPSILENEQFQAVRKRLGDVKATGITFDDLARIAPETYGPWSVISRYAGFADLFGIDSPPLILPPMDVLMENLGPSGSVSWVDDTGFHMRDTSPFPGSEVFGTDPSRLYMTAAPAMAISILLPALSKARETANRVKDSVNLRMIAQGCLLYANEHSGKFPPDQATIFKTQDVIPRTFISPLNNNPKTPQGAGDVMAQWVEQNSDYVYRGAGLSSSAPADVPLAYDKPEIAASRGGMNIVFCDGHVEWMSMADAQRVIDRK